ncbi:MAG: hypothetical protein KJ559_02730 [Nanoarchaeota archaeon]|nr:hypothetical protein [Nanoarchaeota archaeon]
MNKKGRFVVENIIFLVLNLVFFVVILSFIIANTSGRPVYEKAYAKQIALLIDSAKPDMHIIIDLENLVKKYDKLVFDIVRIDNKEKKVSLNLGSGGQSYLFWTESKIDYEFKGNQLIIDVTK